MQSSIRHLEVGSGWPVPTWKLRTERQSLQAASELPAKLSASIRVGATLVAMMGDQSQSMRGSWNQTSANVDRHEAKA